MNASIRVGQGDREAYPPQKIWEALPIPLICEPELAENALSMKMLYEFNER